MISLKKLIKKVIPKSFLNHYSNYINLQYRVERLEREKKANWISQRIKTKNPDELLKYSEFKIYSQTGEDGIIDYIFSKIGIKNKTFVEFGVEDGKECNTANLSMNFGWKGLLMEGNKEDVIKAKRFYRGKPVKIAHAFITKENINKLISENAIKGEIDLLSIDIDGNDYWVWKAIDVINPRVVVIEYNSTFANRSLTIDYDSKFTRYKKEKSGLYYGSSLPALVKLGKEKGYTFVGSGSEVSNAFFVRNDIVRGKLKEASLEKIKYINPGRERKFGDINQQFNLIKHLKFVKI